MRWLLAALLALAALTTPTLAGAANITPTEAQDLVASTGCSAVVSSIPYSKFNAYYSPSQHRIVTIGFDTIPLRWQRLILLHEAGHCLQAQEDRFASLSQRGPQEIEWDADAFAIKAYSDRFGGDGAELNQEIWATLYQQYDYEGDPDEAHGSSVDRITRGNLNRTAPRVES